MKAYKGLLAAAKRDPRGADFTELRLAYARSREYDPYLSDKDATEAFAKATLARQVDDVAGLIQALQVLLELRFLEIEAHRLAVLAYERVGDDAKAAYHRAVVKGCLSSILQSGDGQSFETAFQVVTISEEWSVLKAWGLRPTEKQLVHHGAGFYDVFSCRKGETVETVEIYFNADVPFRSLDEDGVAKILAGGQALPERPAIDDRRRARLARKMKPVAGKLYVAAVCCLGLGVLMMGLGNAEGVRALEIAGVVVTLVGTLGAIAGGVLLMLVASE